MILNIINIKLLIMNKKFMQVKNLGGGGQVQKIDPEGLELQETVIFVNRVSKVVKRWKKIRFCSNDSSR